LGVLLSLADIYIPGFVRKRKLVRLFAATADAFGVSSPPLDGIGPEKCLLDFAEFTKREAEKSMLTGTDGVVKNRLYQNAHRLGQGLREEFGVKSMKDTMKLARLVYRIVGIDFKGTGDGEVVINRCYFSKFYSPGVCGVISSLDAGLLSGLSGGARLGFEQKLTEGADCCRAHLTFGARSK
jgi:hypothetical protein